MTPHTVLVTGANSGLGLSMAVELARREHRTIGTVRSSRKAGELREAAEQAGTEVETALLDVTDAERCAAVYDRLAQSLQRGESFMGDPKDVARTVVRVVERPRPRARYLVGNDARFLDAMRVLPVDRDPGPDPADDGGAVSTTSFAVVGGGSWGTAVAGLLAERHDVVLWAIEPEVVDGVNDHHGTPCSTPTSPLPARPAGHAPTWPRPSTGRRGGRHGRAVPVPPGRARDRIDGPSPATSRSSAWPRASRPDTLLRPTEIIAEVLGRDPPRRRAVAGRTWPAR